MRVATEEEMPLTIVWKKLADDEAVFEVMIVEVPTEPPTLLVRVLPDALRELVVERLVTEREVADALANVLCPVTLRVVRVAVPRSAP